MTELRTPFGSQRFGSVSFTKVSQDTIIREKAWNVSILISKRQHWDSISTFTSLNVGVSTGTRFRPLLPPEDSGLHVQTPGPGPTSTTGQTHHRPPGVQLHFYTRGRAHQLAWRSLSDLHVHLWIFTDDFISLAFHFPPKFPFHVSLQRVVHLSPETCTLSCFQAYVEQVGNPCRAGYESDDRSSPQRTPENMSPILATSKWQLRREEVTILDGATRMRMDDGRLEDKSDDETRHRDRPARTGCQETPRLLPSLPLTWSLHPAG